MKVVITRPAEADIAEIADYIATDNPDRARTFVAELLDACFTLGDMPTRFPIVERYARHGIRRRTYKGYGIFYRCNVAVEVIHILHGARDADELLGS